jgi:hypothetical protein
LGACYTTQQTRTGKRRGAKQAWRFLLLLASTINGTRSGSASNPVRTTIRESFASEGKAGRVSTTTNNRGRTGEESRAACASTTTLTFLADAGGLGEAFLEGVLLLEFRRHLRAKGVEKELDGRARVSERGSGSARKKKPPHNKNELT